MMYIFLEIVYKIRRAKSSTKTVCILQGNILRMVGTIQITGYHVVVIAGMHGHITEH